MTFDETGIPPHTPGPWHAQCRSLSDGSLIVTAAEREICLLRPQGERRYGVEDNEDQANARLIAAAPQLVVALADLLGDLPDMSLVNGMIECRHCGRRYDPHVHEENDIAPPQDARACDEDCPGRIAREALAEALPAT